MKSLLLVLSILASSCGHWGNIDYHLPYDISVIDRGPGSIPPDDYVTALEMFTWALVDRGLYGSYDEAISFIWGLLVVLEDGPFKCNVFDYNTGKAVESTCLGLAITNNHMIRVADLDTGCVGDTSFVHELAHIISYNLFNDSDGAHKREVFYSAGGIVVAVNKRLKLEVCDEP